MILHYKQPYSKFISSCLLLLISFCVHANTVNDQNPLIAPEFELYYFPGEEDYLHLTFRNENAGASTEIYHSLSENSGYTLVTTVGPGVTEYDHKNLKPRTVHYYKLKARLGDQTSEFSEVYYMETYSKNYPPILTARAINANTIELSITDKSYNDIAYNIFTTVDNTTYQRTDDFYGEVSHATDSGSTETILHFPAEAGKTYHYAVDLVPFHDQSVAGFVTRTSFTMPLPECDDAGSVEREVWTNVPGGKVSSIPVYRIPDQVTIMTSLQGPVNSGDNFGARVRGYLCAPQTGNYTFWIASDDQSELRLSTDATTENRKLIASVTGYTTASQWEKYPTQKSVAIPLQAGTVYYFEVLHKESGSGDHFAVGWQLPNGTLERPIGGNRIIRFGRPSEQPLVFVKSSSANAYTAPATVTLLADAYDPESAITKVDFFLNSTFVGSDASAPYSVQVHNLPAAHYQVRAVAYSTEGQQGDGYSVFDVQAPACSGAGTVQREIWRNIAGTDVYSIPVNTTPSSSETLTGLQTAQYRYDNYGSRIRGYICAPLTGAYMFWISADDASQFWLSTDESPSNKRLRASVTSATKFKEYSKNHQQFTGVISLQAGQKYYFEILHKEGTGNDFVTVKWQMPNGTVEDPVSGSRLLPFGALTQNQSPVVDITSPTDQAVYQQGSTVTFRANASDSDGTIASVRFEVNGSLFSEDSSAPYEFAWTNSPAGTYNIVARAKDDKGATATDNVTITINPAVTCSGSGELYRELWLNIPGTSVSSIPTGTEPDQVTVLTSFTTPNYTANSYGSRIRGYVCVPTNGVYTFSISSDDNSELYLSTDDNPANKVKIAYLTAAVRPGVYTQYASQTSTPISLQAGRRYYIEALHKEGSGADFVSVGWKLPDGTFQAPIPGNRLSPFEDLSTSAAMFVDSELGLDEFELSVYPNPVKRGQSISITVDELDEVGETSFDLISPMGRSVQSELVKSRNGMIEITIQDKLASGFYFATITSGRKRWVKKLMVE